MRPNILVADRFAIEHQIGAGGMGVVYRALDRTSGAPVALKLVAGHDERLRARAVAEADALAALDHPAIVRLIAHGHTSNGRPFLATEWLDGEDLAVRLARAPLSPRDATVLGARVAGALAAVHARGVIHRDLKPANLFLPSGDIARVKLLDFGIARLTELAPRLTTTGDLVGTPAYMSPEQANGSHEVGPPTDLFSLGAVLFECVAGRPAFSGSHIMAVLAKILLEEPPRLDDTRADIPSTLADLVACLLAKRAADRPVAAAVAAALDVLLLESEATARGETLDGADLRGSRRAEPSRPPRAVESVTGEEQRLVCVLLTRTALPLDAGPPAAPPASSGPPDSVDALEATLPPIAAPLSGSIATDHHAFGRLRAVVEPLGGRAARLLDRSLVASWLDPGSPRDQAMRATRAALLARERLPDAAFALASGLTLLHGVLPLGPVLDRAAALLEAGEPHASGETCGPRDMRETCEARAPRASRTGAIFVDEVTAGLLDARFEISPLPGGSQLVGERTLDEEQTRLLLGQPSPCVGRERELRTLGDLLDECVAEPVARAVLVTAPPGTGKSRLRHELLRVVRLRGDVEIWTACADELGAGSPFALIGAALQRAVGTQPGAPADEQHRQIQQRVARRLPEAERARVAAFLGEIAGAPFPADAHPRLGLARLNPAMMAEQVQRAWFDLLAAETAVRPVLLVLEDLHWSDAPSLQLVDAALAALEDRPLMVLGMARPTLHDRFPGLWAARGVQEIRLGALTRRAAAQLVRHALPGAEDALVERLVRRAEGNAFYLEELIRAAASGDGEALPETVAAMVQARIEALSPEDRRLLRAASVFGEAFWERGALALLGAERAKHDAQRERIDALVARELLVRRPESRFPAEQELAFRHALLRDGAYAALPEIDRARAHGCAAAWLEEAGEGDPLILGAHYERGGEAARAAGWYLRATERALASNELGAALALAERALELGPEEELRPRVLRALMLGNWFEGRLAETERWADQILASAPRGSGAWCSAGHILVLLQTQRADRQRADPEAITCGITAADALEATPENAEPLLRLLSSLSFMLSLAGYGSLAASYNTRADAILGALGASIEPGALGFVLYVRTYWMLFNELRLEQAVHDAEQAMRCFEATSDRLYGGLARFALGFVLWHLGALERAEAELRGVTEEAAPRAHSGMLGRVFLSRVLTDRGARAEAVVEAQRAIGEAEAAMDRIAEALGRTALAYALQREGDVAGAEGEIRRVVGQESLPVVTRTEIQVELAEVRLAQGDASEALALARELTGVEARSSAAVRLAARGVEAQALLAQGEREAARALLGAVRGEIVAIAGRIEDEALREGFLARGQLARALRVVTGKLA